MGKGVTELDGTGRDWTGLKGNTTLEDKTSSISSPHSYWLDALEKSLSD